MKVAIYCRLSEEDKNKLNETDDSESIQNQKSMLIQYATERLWEIYNIYSDDDFAGSNRNRPAFNQLLIDAENQSFDIILCKTQARFTRELELVEKYIHGLFPLWNIRFVSIVDNADSDVKGNKKSRQINGLVNEWYLEDMSENIKSVLINKRKNGLHIGAFALYGYQKDPHLKGHLIIDAKAAEIVIEIFTLFSLGYGKTAIARLLNDRGVPNPTEYKRQSGLRYQQPKQKNSTLWTYFAISDMLVNEMYIGTMVQGRYGSASYKTKQNKPIPKEQWIRVLNTHEAIINRDLWDRVQALIKQKAKPFAVGKIGLFSKKVKCLHCGYTLRSSQNLNKYYLQCPSHHFSSTACIGAFISVEKLEQAVIAELNAMTEKLLDKEKLLYKVKFSENLLRNKAKLALDITAYNKKINEYIIGLKELYLDKAKGIISKEEYFSFSKDFSAEKEKLENNIQLLEEELRSIDQELKQEENHEQQLTKHCSITKLNREIIDTFIDFIAVGKRSRGIRQVPIEIHWKF